MYEHWRLCDTGLILVDPRIRVAKLCTIVRIAHLATDERVFVDTNVLVYAHDVSAGVKRERVAQVIDELWSTGQGVLSTQVLQEWYITCTRKLRKTLTPHQAAELIQDYSAWTVITIESSDVLSAIRLSMTDNLSLWDALIVVAAIKGHANTLLSEDFTDGHRFGSVTVSNPLLG